MENLKAEIECIARHVDFAINDLMTGLNPLTKGTDIGFEFTCIAGNRLLDVKETLRVLLEQL